MTPRTFSGMATPGGARTPPSGAATPGGEATSPSGPAIRPSSAATRPDLGLIVTWALIVLGVVYLMVGGGGGTLGIYFIYFRIASVAIVVVGLLVWLRIGLRDRFWRPRSALTPAILACVAALAIADLASEHPRIGYDFVAYAVLLAGAYLLLQRLFAHPFFGPRLGMLGVLLCVGISGIYIAAVVNSWIQLWSELGRIVTPPLRPFPVFLVYGNPNPIATVVILLWVASVVHLGLSTSRAQWTVAAVSGFSATAVFLTGSRGAWAAFGLAALIVLFFWLASAHRRRDVALFLRRDAPSLFRLRRIRIAGAGLLIALAVVAIVLFPVIARRVGAPATDTRLVFATASTRMFLSHPLTGVGPGMWVVDRLRMSDPTDGDLYVPHAHNIILQSLAELGLVGALAGAVVVVFLAGLVLRGARSPNSLTQRLAWGALFASVYFVACQMTDFFANLPAIGFAYALTIARLDAMVIAERPPSRGSARSHTAVAAALAVAFAVATLWLAHSEEAALHADRAVSSANADNWSEARASAALAVTHDPGMPPYLFALGLAEAHAGDLAAALAHIRESAEIDDYPTAWLDVAQLELDMGHEAEARQAVQAAMRLGYQEPKVAVGASAIEVELGDQAAAVSALASALVFAPGLASDPYWNDPSRRPLFEEALSDALDETSPDVGYKIAVEGGRPEAAHAIIGKLAPDERLVPELFARAWIGDRAAFDQLHGLATSGPLNDEAGALCRRIAERSLEPGWPGGTPWACAGTGPPAAIIVVRVDPPPAWWAVLPGANAFQHYPFVYRRFAPGDELVPGLPHVGSTLT